MVVRKGDVMNESAQPVILNEFASDAATRYVPTKEDRQSYPWRFGSLAMAARLFLLGLAPRADFVREVNAAHEGTGFPPIPEDALAEPIKPTTALLRDVLEMLHVVAELAEDEAEILDDDGHPAPNRAYRIQMALEGNQYRPGLIARVSDALENSVLTGHDEATCGTCQRNRAASHGERHVSCSDDFIDSPADGYAMKEGK